MNLPQEEIRVLRIVDGTSVDGPGLRTSIYFSGCLHHCPGCHNPQSWAFDNGDIVSVDTLIEHIKKNDFDVTFSGGDPFYRAKALIPLAKAIRNEGKTLWIYTGFLFEELLQDPDMRQLASLANVIVDGPFITNLKKSGLRFKGSENQRLIDVEASIKANSPILWHDDSAWEY